jgi:hypothetical protein
LRDAVRAEASIESGIALNSRLRGNAEMANLQTFLNWHRRRLMNFRVAIVSHREREAREAVPPEQGRFAKVFEALAALGTQPEAVPYHDDTCDAVRDRLMAMDGVLVWVNPEEGGRDRSMLDAMLRSVASTGVFVSAHPEVILKLGTKEVLYRTRGLGWGCDTDLYRSLEELRARLPARLLAGEVRVLKQYRGHGGDGVWKVEIARDGVGQAKVSAMADKAEDLLVRVRHAARGSTEQVVAMGELLRRCEPYFAGEGRIIDQAYQPRLPEGMVRCYLVHGEVAGFGLQAVNALHPSASPSDAPPVPTPRSYHPPTLPQYQPLKQALESEWVPQMQRLFALETEALPVLWDCDFLLGPKMSSGEDSYVLCEINASSVSPFPDSAAQPLARTTIARIEAMRRRRD